MIVGARLLPLAYLAFVVHGMPQGVGVAWPTMSNDFTRSLAELGVLLAVWSGGYLVATALNGYLTDRVGAGEVLAGSAAFTAVAFIGAALAPLWLALLAFILLLGCSSGLVDAGVNAHVATRHGARAMGLLHGSFGVGAVLGPLLMTVALQVPGTWRLAFGVLAAANGAIALAVFRTRERWRIRPAGQVVTRPRARSARLLFVSMLVFFLYAGIEVAAGQWAFSLFTEERGMADGAAGAWVAAYWGAFTAGRFVLGAIGDRVRPQTMVHLGLAGLVVGASLLWLREPGWIGPIGLVVLGASAAPIFPSLMVLTPGRLGAGFASWAVGYQLAAASLGIAAIPGLVGITVALAGLETLAPVLLAATAALIVTEAALRTADQAAAAGTAR